MSHTPVKSLVLAFLFFCGHVATADTITGIATFRERIMPPADARLVVTLLDTSRAGAAATELGRVEINDAVGPPYPFKMAYNADEIDARHSYGVRATLWVDDQMMFTTDTFTPVLTQGATSDVHMVMVRVPSTSREQARMTPDASLSNTYWRIDMLAGEDVMQQPTGRREPHLILRDTENRFSATVGCNRINGNFTSENDGLGFGQSAVTRMACPPPLDALEQNLLSVLAATRNYRIHGDTLTFYNGANEAIAIMTAVYLY